MHTHTHTLAFTTLLVTLLSATGHYQDDYKVRKGAWLLVWKKKGKSKQDEELVQIYDELWGRAVDRCSYTQRKHDNVLQLQCFDHQVYRRPNTFTNTARSWSSDGYTFPRKKQRHKMWGLSTYLPPQSCCAVAPLQKRRQHGLWKHTATLHIHPQPSQVLIHLKTHSHIVHTYLWPSFCS